MVSRISHTFVQHYEVKYAMQPLPCTSQLYGLSPV